MTTVFAGNEDLWKYVLGEFEEEEPNMDPPGEGRAVRAECVNAAARIVGSCLLRGISLETAREDIMLVMTPAGDERMADRIDLRNVVG